MHDVYNDVRWGLGVWWREHSSARALGSMKMIVDDLREGPLCCIFWGIRLSEPEATQLDAQIVNPSPSTPNPIQFSKFGAHHRRSFLAKNDPIPLRFQSPGRKMVVNPCNVEMKWCTPQGSSERTWGFAPEFLGYVIHQHSTHQTEKTALSSKKR